MRNIKVVFGFPFSTANTTIYDITNPDDVLNLQDVKEVSINLEGKFPIVRFKELKTNKKGVFYKRNGEFVTEDKEGVLTAVEIRQ
jgi:hypothetical protein